jgi:hypothetical protein
VAHQHNSVSEGDDDGIPIGAALDFPPFTGLPNDRVVCDLRSGWPSAVQIPQQLYEGFLFGVMSAGQVNDVIAYVDLEG